MEIHVYTRIDYKIINIYIYIFFNAMFSIAVIVKRPSEWR